MARFATTLALSLTLILAALFVQGTQASTKLVQTKPCVWKGPVRGDRQTPNAALVTTIKKNTLTCLLFWKIVMLTFIVFVFFLSFFLFAVSFLPRFPSQSGHTFDLNPLENPNG